MKVFRFLLLFLMVGFFSTILSTGKIYQSSCQAGVMMQGFYWNVPSGWYNTLASKARELKSAGFTAIWFPSPVKCDTGSSSMGYDPFDHYDLGDYNQKGTTKTRFGSKSELKQAVSAYRSNGIDVYVDIVMNHMDGGAKENNPDTGTQTYTLFKYPHKKFEKDYKCFIPNRSCSHFPGEPSFCGSWGVELCHSNKYVADGLKEWGNWLTREIGFNGYRLDAVKCIDSGFLSSWLSFGAMRGKFAVGEYDDGNRNAVNNWIHSVGSKAAAFDFPLFYNDLKEMCNNTSGGYDMRRLDHAGLAGINPTKAVTFVENHDTDRNSPIRTDKMLAYAYILTGEGYPCVFWKDYYNYNLRSKINPLIWIHEHLAAGTTTVLYKDNDLYVAKRNTNPGLIVFINDNPREGRNAGNIQTPWKNRTLMDYTGNVKDTPKTDGNGYVVDYQLWAPARSYTVWSPK